MRRILIPVAVLVIAGIVGLFFVRGCSRPSQKPELALVEPVEETLVEESVVTVSTAVTNVPPPKEPVKEVKPPPPPPKKAVSPPLQPPPVEIHKELIPQNIEIVRVYYATTLAGPGDTIEFDINGSGFTREFEKMIKVESGHSKVSIRDLALRTPNQIHGTLVVNEKAETAVAFPRVLIQGKVVFQAPEPFAVIRLGEVLNVVFTEMGESGRTGRFRVFTHLTPEMVPDFTVQSSTTAIQIADLTPALPFLVDGDIRIGPAAGGEYDLTVRLNDKILWNREGIIRVVKPNVGQTGLVQRLQGTEDFYRPGDRAFFLIQGSGFQPEDPQRLTVQVPGLEIKTSTFVYLAPGRMELSIGIPPTTPRGRYGLIVSQGEQRLLESDNAFEVVDKNWMRGLRLQSELKPGGASTLYLIGRDMEAGFISGLHIELDEPALHVGPFQWDNPNQASASINAGEDVKPGDYLLHMSSEGKPVSPQFGSIIRVSKK